MDRVQIPSVETNNYIHIYQADADDTKSFLNKLWQDGPSFWESITGVVENALACIVSLHAIPQTPRGILETTEPVVVGNKYFDDITMKPINRYYRSGSKAITIDGYYDTALDYEPYSKCWVYLPFVGIRPLKCTDVINKRLALEYCIDFLTGDIIYSLQSGEGEAGSGVGMYYFKGNCKVDIPITSADYSRFVSGAVNSAVSVGMSLAGGNTIGAVGGAVSGILSGVQNYNTPDISHESIQGNAGAMGCLTPYVIVESPVAHVGENYGNLVGYPSYITATLGEVTGFTQVASVHLDGITATSQEKSEIMQKLQEGVIL